MAKIKLSDNNFKIIPEGVTTFKIMEVDDSKYEDFGKLSVKMQTAKGETHTETFTLTKKSGELNEGALKAWSYFARICLNNSSADEIDTQDIVGCYITVTVKHEKSEGTGDNAGKTYTNVRLNDFTTASGFGVGAKANVEVESEDDIDDLDDLDNFLND